MTKCGIHKDKSVEEPRLTIRPDEDDDQEGSPRETGEPDLIEIEPILHVKGKDWTLESKIYHAFVRRLGGIVCLLKDEIEPGPNCGLVIQREKSGGLCFRSDTLGCRLPDRIADRFQNDIDFNYLCNWLSKLVAEGKFSCADLLDAVTVAKALRTHADLEGPCSENA